MCAWLQVWANASKVGRKCEWWQTRNITAFKSRKCGRCFYPGCFSYANRAAKKSFRKSKLNLCKRCRQQPPCSLLGKERINVQYSGRCWFASELPKPWEIYAFWAWAQSHLQARGVLAGVKGQPLYGRAGLWWSEKSCFCSARISFAQVNPQMLLSLTLMGIIVAV